jgi:hypothetical protein
MIDPSLHVAHTAIWLFLLRKIFFIYTTPVILGFLVATLYPVGTRAASRQLALWRVILAAGIAPAVMLLGWSFVARAPVTAPLYGLGYGIGVALLSRVHSIRLAPFRIETRVQAQARIAACRRVAEG